MADATVYNQLGSVAASSLIPQAEESICATPWNEFEAGACTVELDVEITAEEMDVGSSAFSADQREDGARIAVVYGTHDDTGLVLDKLEMGHAYDMFSDSIYAPDTFVLLFEDLDGNGNADIYNYDLVFFDCGMDAIAAVAGDRAAALRAFVEAGGTIYATDWSYLIVEQAFPEFIDFRGDDDEPFDVMSGHEIERLDAVVADGALASWLDESTCGEGSCLNADGTVRLLNFENLWAVMDGAEATAGASVKVLVEGDISLPRAEPDIVPLAVTFEVGAGQIIFTSFHSHSGDEGSAFMPQERVLEYMVSGY